MARISGRNGRLYVGITSGGTAEPIAFLKKWDANQAVDKYDVTAWGDGNKTAVAGWPDATGNFEGFLDTQTQQTYTAAADGVARKAYFYSDTTNASAPYWFVTAIFDTSTEIPNDGPATIKGTWAASSTFIRVN